MGWKWGFFTAAMVALSVATWAAGYPWLSERITPPHESTSLAIEAVGAARSAGAGTWAPALLREAESNLRLSLAERRRQEVRVILLRNYADARALLSLTQSQADEATRTARLQRGLAEVEASSSLSSASLAVASAERMSRAIPLDADGRRHLARARSALIEARYHRDNGDPRRAEELSEEALQQAQDAVTRANTLAARYVDEEQIRTWRRWIVETVAASKKTGGAAIVVNKDKHLVTLYLAGRAVRSYRADMGRNKLNDKSRAGDLATPEGRYKIISKKGPNSSRYHRALQLDYPNAADLRRFESARRSGELKNNARPGGLIEIHGEGGRGIDWTDGCVALSNKDMDDLYPRIQLGTPVTIVGGDGSGGVFSRAIQDAVEENRIK
ncbi:MAG: L,D-transpeptidase [Gemmatimonadota bacterium]|nr:MAG: L,D-transpeptidase [Gemmatimonadota bacterium]